MKKVLGFIKKHSLSLVFLLISFLIMGWIFSFSAEVSEESSETSRGVSYFIASVIVGGFSDLTETEKEVQVSELVPIVRKVAHFTIYAALGFFLMLSASLFYLENKQNIKRDVASAVALGVSLFYAATDEFHQLFVEGRSGSVRDVCIDFCGALVGVLFAVFVLALYQKIRQKREEKKLYNK
ncbi:MAG: VanZ family protein [Oscillospiraceae bacterium]|nr:VanZ family protein [Oscillospiraceae bacterium]